MTGRNSAYTLLLLAVLLAAPDASAAETGPRQVCAAPSSPAISETQRLAACSTALQMDLPPAERAMALMIKGQAEIDQNRPVRALTDLVQAEPPPASAAMLNSLIGDTYIHLGYITRALPLLDAAIRIDPRFAPARSLRGYAYGELLQYDRAISDLYLAVLLAPDQPEARYSRGVVYSAMGQTDRALTDYAEAIRIQPNFPDVYYARAHTYAMMGQFDHAQSDIDEALRLDPALPQAAELRATIMEDRAAHAARAGAPPLPPQPDANGIVPSMAVGGTHTCGLYYPDLSMRLYEAGDVVIHYDVGADSLISNVGVLATSGSERLDAAAVRCVTQGWRNTAMLKNGVPVASPNHQARIVFSPRQLPVGADLYESRGLAHTMLGEYTEATEDYDQAIAAQPGDADLLFDRGFSYLALADYTDAIRDFEAGLKLKPGDDELAAARDLARWQMAHPAPEPIRPPHPGI